MRLRLTRRASILWVFVASVLLVLVSVPTVVHAAPGDAQVTISLVDSAGAALDGGVVSYYSGGWHTLPDPTTGGVVQVELPPGTYSFKMVYNGTAVQRDGVAVAAPTTTVPFSTAAVTVSLKDSGGNLLDGGVASYYAGGWHTIGPTVAGVVSVEMLSGSYSFAMNYNGMNKQLDGVAVGTPTTTVPFNTVAVTVSLKDSSGNPLDGGVAGYYANGWHTIGPTVAGVVSVEMLSVPYSFEMVYNGTREQRDGVAVSAATPTVPFKTTKVTVHLLRTDDSSPVSGGAVSFYASGWRSLGTTSGAGTVSAQLLVGTYPFRMLYLGIFQQQSGTLTLGAEADVIFYTNNTPPLITSGPPPTTATVGTAFAFTVTATGYPAPTFAITGGSLPDGLALDPITGVISGTPTQTGTFSFTVRAHNGIGTDALANYTTQVGDAQAAGTQDGTSLADTGAALGPAAPIGFVAVIGGLLVLAIRRRMKLADRNS